MRLAGRFLSPPPPFIGAACFVTVQVHWRLYLEIADLARRENRFVEARKLYRKVGVVKKKSCRQRLCYDDIGIIVLANATTY